MPVTIDGTNGITTPATTTTGAIVSGTTVADATAVIRPLVSGTAVSASGTSVDFTSIPSWVKRITVMFDGVSTNSTANYIIQLGTGATTYETSGYAGSCSSQSGTATSMASASGFIIKNSNNASDIHHGLATICLLSSSSNTWSETSILGLSNAGSLRYSGGTVSLSDSLTAIRITTEGGTNTFDAGSINILYE